MPRYSTWDRGLDRHKVQPARAARNLQIERDQLPVPVKPHTIDTEYPAVVLAVDGEGQTGLTLGAMQFEVAEGQKTALERHSQIADRDGTHLGLGEGKVRNVTRGGPDKRQDDSTNAGDEQKDKDQCPIVTKQAKLDAVQFQYVWKQRHSLASLAHIAPYGSSHLKR